MGTKVQCKSYLPGYYSMRDLNEDSSSSSWPLFYGDENLTSGQYCNNGFTPRTMTDRYLGHDKDALKQKMLEHEMIFKNQVHELHRLYRIQRDMMEEAKRKELQKHRASIEPSSSSSLHGSQMPPNNAQNCQKPNIPFLNSSYGTSIPGFETVSSPLSCTKANNTQTRPFHFQDACTSKEEHALDSRPSKVRKKLFDLELPADEYIHPDEPPEKLPDGKFSGMLSYIANGDPKIEPLNGTKFSFGNGGTSNVHRGVSISDSRLRGSGALADLNEPILIEDVTVPSCGFGGHSSSRGEINGISPLAKGNPQVLGVPREIVHSRNGLIIPSMESKGNERGWLSHIYEAGTSRSKPSPVTQALQQNKLPISCQSSQVMLNQACHRPGFYPNSYIRDDLWRDGPHCGLDKTRDHSTSSHLEPLVGPHTRGPYMSGVANSWSQSISSWTKPTNSFTQKLTAGQPSFSSAAGLQPYEPTKEKFGDRWQVNASSSSGFEKLLSGPSRVDLKPMIDINLNEVLPTTSASDDQHTALPWLKAKPVKPKPELVSDLNRKFIPNVIDLETIAEKEICETQTIEKILGFPIFEHNNACKIESTDQILEVKKVTDERKRMIDINVACDSDEEVVVEKKVCAEAAIVRHHIDLNSSISISEDEDPPVPCIASNKDPPVPCIASNNGCTKIVLDIDLEAPALLDGEDDIIPPLKENIQQPEASLEQKPEEVQDEVLRDAAEAIFSITTSRLEIHTDDSWDPLTWFADVLSSSADEPEGKSVKESRLADYEMDEFEAMTLQLPETKEEDYMPKPFIPEVANVDEAGPTRARRGQSRRGRPRRDFQRDILPGLTSLSRNEVTEDLQTFGGLMRATGHSWSSGLTRRNGTRYGGARGRRRTVIDTAPTAISSPVSVPSKQQVSNIEARLEDGSLTGWGKTTRRPRRQRCPAGNGNLPTVALS